MNSQGFFTGNVNQKLLLIGDMEDVFLNGSKISDSSIEYYRDIPAGVAAAGKKQYRAVAITMSISTQFESVLRQLKKVNPGAKIILLAQMYQEPQAIHLVDLSENFPLADDYLICPVSVEDLGGFVVNSLQSEPIDSISYPGNNSDMEKKIRRLERLATTDDLTGLKNRRYVYEFCRQIIDFARENGCRVTLLMFDIDYFKNYNDKYSHSAGDEVLKQVAVLLCRCCRPHDVVGRIGGDEFVVIFWDEPKKTSGPVEQDRRFSQTDHPRQAIFIAKRIQRELKKANLTLLAPEGSGLLTISGGLVSFPRDGTNAQELFDRADKALLEAKRSGKNRIYLVGSDQSDIADIK